MAKKKTKKPAKKSTRKASRKVVKVAMIGAGGRAQSVHYPSLRDMKDVKMVAVCEMNEARMNQAAQKYDIPGQYTNYVEMIEKEKPDVVYAIMPPHHVFDLAANIMDMGVNIVIEKPPAVTTEQAKQMALMAKKNKVITGVTFQRRFAPVIRTAKEICEKQGPVHSAASYFYKNEVGGRALYKGAMEKLMCDGIHAVDTLRYLCGGEVEAVASDVRRMDATFRNMHTALVRFSSGATGVLQNCYMMGRRIFSVEVHSTGVSVFGDPEEGGQVFADGKVEPVRELDPWALSKSQEPHVAFGAYGINRHFIDCVKSGKQPETNFEDASKSMALVDAIYASQI